MRYVIRMKDQKVYLWLLLPSLALVRSEVSAQGSCEPNCIGQADFSKVPDPYNCTKYYICIDEEPTPESIPCGEEEYFDGVDCVENSQPCSPICSPGGGDNCKLTCSYVGEFINDPTDCTGYYECAIGGILNRECPPERPYFNSKKNNSGFICGLDESVCCVPPCTPYCKSSNTMITDPNSCQHYYLCTEIGEPPEEMKMPCASDEHFEIPLGKCSNYGVCQVLCQSSSTSSTVSSNISIYSV
ncbi:hypothetical protein SK128_025834 [Halocaridina rubra]|uniref:Chitin-binding type-2 domain-containing protein n=1 Tax=Halocaridina rubra TaxID=373956 RepID=A0AAN8ZTC9_HALRR